MYAFICLLFTALDRSTYKLVDAMIVTLLVYGRQQFARDPSIVLLVKHY